MNTPPETAEALNDTQKQDMIIEISKIIHRYQDAGEATIKGQRFLLPPNNEEEMIPFGYPYPDSREKYIVQDILKFLSPNDND